MNWCFDTYFFLPRNLFLTQFILSINQEFKVFGSLTTNLKLNDLYNKKVDIFATFFKNNIYSSQLKANASKCF